MTARSSHAFTKVALASFSLAGLMLALPVAAQTPSPQNPPPPEQAPLPDAATHLFGDWDGFRTDLYNMGIKFSLDYTAEIASNVSGGLRTGTDYAHQVSFGTDIDWQQLANIDGFSTHTAMVQRAGRNASNDYIGDHVLQAQEIYGAGFGQAVHLVYAYLEEKVLDGRIDVAGGRMFPGVDFAASPLYCNFMTLTICGHERALTSTQGFIDWPQNTWGGRVKARPTEDTYIMIGGFQSQPFPGGGRSGFDFSSSKATGTTIPVEVSWEPVFPNNMQGHYKLGYVYDTSRFDDNFADGSGGAFVLSGEPARKDQGRSSFYVNVDQLVWRTGPGPQQGLTLLATYTHNDPGTSLFDNFIWTGLLYSGFWPSRPNDQIGLAYTWYQVSHALTATEDLEEQFNLPPTYALGVQNAGGVIEANYSIPIIQGFQIQPEFEYWMHPGGVTNVPNAVVFGAKVHVSF